MFKTPLHLPGGLIAAALLTMMVSTQEAQGQVVISQIYAGGGEAGATYNRDYIELFNQGLESVNIGTWAIQYQAATNSGNYSRFNIPANTSIGARSYLLIVRTPTGGNGAALSGDVTIGFTDMAIAGGKVALTNNQVMLTGAPPTVPGPIVDLVGWGSANHREGTANAPAMANNAPAMANNTVALFRADAGCTDTNQNSADFASAAANPRTAAVKNVACPPPVVSSTVPGSGGFLGLNFTVNFNKAVTGVTASALTVDGSPATSVTGSGAGPYVFTGYSSPVGPGPYTVTLQNTGIIVTPSEELAAPYTISVNTFSDVQPTPVITSTTVNPGDVTRVAHDFTVTFSEPVTNFTLSDIQVTNGTASNFLADLILPDTVFTFRVTPITLGPVVVTIPEAAAFAVAVPNNPSDSATFSWNNDPIGPRVDSQTVIPPATQNPVGVLTTTFDEPLVGFTINDIAFLKDGIEQDISSLPFILSNGDRTVTVDVSALTVDEALYGVLIGALTGAATDALGNRVVGPAVYAWTKDNTAPAVTLTAPADNTIVGTSAVLATTLNFINGPTIPANSGLVSRRLEVQTPGSTSFVDAMLLPVFGNYNLTFVQDGRHSYRVVAEDEAGNVGISPVVDVYVNRVANAAFTQTVTSANETLVWPQTNVEDVIIALSGATVGATINVERQFFPFTKPSNFDPAKLSNERLLITQSGLGSFTATLTWDYDAASAGSLAIDHVYRANNGGPLNYAYPVTPSGGRVVATGIDGFSEWYVGESTANVDDWSLMAD